MDKNQRNHLIYLLSAALSDFRWIEGVDMGANFKSSIRGLEFVIDFLRHEKVES